MKYHIITYGCQMNKSDSERIAAVLEKIGYKSIKANSSAEALAKADLIVIVSCSVRQMAIDRVYGLISNIKSTIIKTKTKKRKIIVTGCLPEKDKEKLKKMVDLVFDINQLTTLPKLLGRFEKLASKQLNDYFKILPKYSITPIAYIPIMTGCDNFCTYCVVPYTRGREISRPAKEIIEEIGRVIKMGYKLIILLGQNVNSYKSKIPNPTSQRNLKFKIKNSKQKTINFAQLLKIINNLPGDFWLTFVSSHPKDLSDELIKTMAKCKKVMPYLHLPVQAGNNEILRRMNRNYNVTHYKRLIRNIRSTFAFVRKGSERDISISTDIIVGFPGETKKQFSDTAKLMREIKFDMAYLAKYSPRPGTAAWRLSDNISPHEKERRWKILAKILTKTALENNKKYVGKIIDVLVENKKNGQIFGRSRSFKNIKIKNFSVPGRQSSITTLSGQVVKVKIIKATPWGLEGKIMK